MVGGGKMGEALVSGLLRSGWGTPGAPQITVVEADSARRRYWETHYQGLPVADAIENVGEPAGEAVIAVKPTDVEAVCRQLAASGVTRVLSIAAGVTLSTLEGWLGKRAVLRAMPNTPSLVGSGAAAVSAGTRAGEADVEWAKEILLAVGTVVELPEKSLDGVTGLSGSGPAYVFLLAEALVDAGVLVGLSRQVARDLAVGTLLGSARLLAETGEEPSVLRASVTSPGGTTAAGLRALEAAGFRSAVLEAVSASTERAHQLGS
jgi:pyrroline-5-carboxylate reductase